MATTAVRLNAKPAIVEELSMEHLVENQPRKFGRWLDGKINGAGCKPMVDPKNSGAIDGVKKLKQDLGL